MSETTPLLVRDSAHAHHANGHHTRQHGGSTTFQFLADSSYTPGRDSSNILVRAAAETWHVTKVTLLSSLSIATTLKKASSANLT